MLFIYCFALEQINGRVCHVDFGGGVIKRARILLLGIRRHKKQMGCFNYSPHKHLPVKVRGCWTETLSLLWILVVQGIF